MDRWMDEVFGEMDEYVDEALTVSGPKKTEEQTTEARSTDRETEQGTVKPRCTTE